MSHFKIILYYTRKLVGYILILSIILLFLSAYLKDTHPPLEEIDPILLTEPIQTTTKDPAFEVNSEGKTYKINPLYDYEIFGLVVSQHNSNHWLDYYHKRSGDNLNVKDLCLVWGQNIKSTVYSDMKYRSGDFTCFFQTRSNEVYKSFNPQALSNNHLLISEPALRNKIESIKNGDQVRLKGYLATYSHGEYSRGTSTTRTDTGNGACETIYVTNVEIISTSYPKLDKLNLILKYIIPIIFIAYIVLFFSTPYAPRNTNKKDIVRPLGL